MAQQKVAGFSTPYRFTGKELDSETGLYYYGARYYDPMVGIWHGVDALAEKYPSLSPFCYVADNPILFKDPDGKRIIHGQGTYDKNLIYLINKLSVVQYKWNNGVLAIDKKAKLNKNGSQTYSDKINLAITDKGTITITQSEYYTSNNKVKNVDNDAGGGVTQTPATIAAGPRINPSQKNGDPTVTISGNSYQKLGVPDEPEHILMHELVGHAIPILLNNMKGNAVSNENKIRAELKGDLKVEQRPAEPNHLESTFGNTDTGCDEDNH